MLNKTAFIADGGGRGRPLFKNYWRLSLNIVGEKSWIFNMGGPKKFDLADISLYPYTHQIFFIFVSFKISNYLFVWTFRLAVRWLTHKWSINFACRMLRGSSNKSYLFETLKKSSVFSIIVNIFFSHSTMEEGIKQVKSRRTKEWPILLRVRENVWKTIKIIFQIKMLNWSHKRSNTFFYRLRLNILIKNTFFRSLWITLPWKILLI